MECLGTRLGAGLVTQLMITSTNSKLGVGGVQLNLKVWQIEVRGEKQTTLYMHEWT
jgi:hypothetical protein